MKRYRKIYILLGVLAVACIATLCALRIEERKEQIKNSDEIVLELPTESIRSLSWEHEGESLAFHKDEKWLYDEDEAFPVDEEKINGLLEQFQAFGVSFVIEEVEDFGQYGLDDPICTIRLETEGETHEIQLGNYSAMDEERYVSIGDGNVYLVKTDPLDAFDVTLSDLIDNDEPPAVNQASQIRFAGSENYEIDYEEESAHTYCADDVYFAQIDGDSLPLDTENVGGYLYGIRHLNLTDYATYNATEEELQTYGLDDPELTVTVDYTTEEDGAETPETFVLHVSRAAEERAAEAAKAAEDAAAAEAADSEEAAEAADGEDAAEADAAAPGEETGASGTAADEAAEETVTAYARVGESQIVYQITADEYKALMDASYDSLRHEEVFTADFDQVNQIRITLDGVDYTITSQDDEDGVRTYYYQEEALDLFDFRNALKALAADSFTREQLAQKAEISLTLSLDNETYPEIEIGLYRYDGSDCLAVINGEPVSLVSRSQVVDLIETVNAIVLN